MYMILYYLSSLFMFNFSLLSFLFSLYFFYFKFVIIMEWMVFSFNSFNINMFIYLDWMTFMFIFTVMIISSMIMLYSSEYMFHDINKVRFFYLMILFIASMILMVISPNLMSILLGWDGLGLVSYCLVIYYQNIFSYNSGLLTILLNRIGDLMIIMSISFMFMYGSMNFVNFNFLNNYIYMMIIIAAFTKSAQFPFSSWLPAAMAAPTPVSSLVHSSTLVTAGIYLLIRFNYLIYLNDKLVFYIVCTGMLTMFMAGLSANFEYDFKKIIAFSTLSQLGLMMVIYGMKNYELSFFHLIIHAMFKSMMFMCSGVVIHSFCNYQDIRFMGKMKDFMPLTSMFFVISSFSLSGMPFMSGFYSKDLILEIIFMNNFSLVMYIFLMLGTMLTLSYSIRLIYYLMKNFNFIPLFKINDSEIMNYSMIILMIFSIFLGYFLNWVIFYNIEIIFLNLYEKISIMLICFLGLILGLLKFFNNLYFNNILMYFMGKMWFLYSFNSIVVKYPLMFGKSFNYLFDKGWSEFFFKGFIYYLLLKMDLFKLNVNNLIYSMLLMFFFMILIMF